MNLYALLNESGHLFPLKESDPVSFAIENMADNRVFSYPVVKNDILIGYVKMSALVDLESSEKIGDHTVPFGGKSLIGNENIFDLIPRFQLWDLDCIAVIDPESKKFTGMVRMWDLLTLFSKSATFHQDGGTMVVEMSALQYSLSHISQICESENTQVIGVLIDKMEEDSNMLQVHLKLNGQNPERIVTAMIRHGFDVPYYSKTGTEPDLLKDRYDSLMKYLDI